MSSPTAEPGAHFRAALQPVLTEQDRLARQRVLALWRRHSQRIQLLRRLFPTLGAVLILVLTAWAVGNALFWRLGTTDQGQGLSIRMLNPHFQGRDDKGKPFVLSAASATRDDQDFQRVTLEAPVLLLDPGLPDQTHIQSLHGVYREDTRILRLDGAVQLQDAQGYRFATERSVIDTNNNDVAGDAPIDGQGPLGRIAASSYAVRDGGAHVFFTGHVRARIENGRAPGAPAAKATR